MKLLKSYPAQRRNSLSKLALHSEKGEAAGAASLCYFSARNDQAYCLCTPAIMAVWPTSLVDNFYLVRLDESVFCGQHFAARSPAPVIALPKS